MGGGGSGGGKSTLSKQLAEKHNALLYSYDTLPKANTFRYAESVRCQMWHDVAQDLSNGKSVVCDDLHTRLKWRSGLLSAISENKCRKVLIVLTTPYEECLQRNANRRFRLPDVFLEHSHNTFEHPTLAEGWDEIIYIDTREEATL